MNRACTCCHKRLPAVPHVCEPCRAGLTRTLATIPGLYADALAQAANSHTPELDDGAHDPVSRALPAGPVPAVSLAPRTSGGPVEAPAPVDLDFVTVIAHNPLAPLAAWVTAWWHDGDTRTDTITWLTQHLDRACDEHADIPTFANDLNQVSRQLRAATRDTRQLLGRCPAEDCDTEIYAHPTDKAATCTGCGKPWPRRHWLWLADTLRTAA